MKEIEFSKIKLENGEIMAYRHVGNGDNVLILVHGFQSSSSFFEDLLESFDQDINVYAPDLIGYGDSTYKIKHKEMKDWAFDLYYFLNALKINRISLAGWSLGGLVCMDFAGLYPDFVKNLILIASVGNEGFIMPDKKEKKDDHFKLKLPNFLKDFSLRHDESFTIPILNGIKDKDIDFFKDLLSQTIFNVNDPDPNDLRKMAEDFIKQKCFLEALLAMVKYDNTKNGSGLINNIIMPTTWMHGDKDMVIPIDNAYKSIENFPKKVNFIEFKDSGHAIFVDEKDKFLLSLYKILGKENKNN
ncbi:alpha/beta hydrolase [Anaerococcus sp. WCA-380-WT-2B]|uniref:Alpha/beta hydrolase n=1 Tax=Anaerococcus porci TaxID=2652269 RepID=A0A6N7VSP4_9FIRM|nr:alpha/beta hydrolase [Anaerococcus porci]MSS77093.1 alpha/beta hydrolase [Anaerococcus porci]